VQQEFAADRSYARVVLSAPVTQCVTELVDLVVSFDPLVCEVRKVQRGLGGGLNLACTSLGLGIGMKNSLGRRMSMMLPVGPCVPVSKWRRGSSYAELRTGFDSVALASDTEPSQIGPTAAIRSTYCRRSLTASNRAGFEAGSRPLRSPGIWVRPERRSTAARAPQTRVVVRADRIDARPPRHHGV
jgi:hypothetical protein